MKKRRRASRQSEQSETNLGKDRITAFSDGVFAIAITLLVLDIHVPSVPQASADALLPERLYDLWPVLFSYALSFAILGVYWVAHHLMLFMLRRIDRTLLWLNNLLLLWIVLIPFSAALLGEYRHSQVAVLIYGANLVLSSLSLQLLWSYASHNRRLLSLHLDASVISGTTRRTLIAASIYLIAMGVSLISTQISLALYWLGPLSYIFMQARFDHNFIRSTDKKTASGKPMSATALEADHS